MSFERRHVIGCGIEDLGAVDVGEVTDYLGVLGQSHRGSFFGTGHDFLARIQL